MMTAIEGLSWTEKRGGTGVGTIADGSTVDLYMLKDSGIEAAIITYGARMVSIRTPDYFGNMANVILSYSGLDSYVADQSSYFGAVVGRYANRIASGRFSIANQELLYRMEQR